MKHKTKVNEIKIGNDGYGSRNITVEETKYGIKISRSDPHGWGCISDTVGIPKESIDELIVFLIKMKQTASQD
jgi:hypothetical protein